MASRYQNITINQGSTFSANVVAYVNTSSTQTINLTPYVSSGSIKKYYTSSSSVLTFIINVLDSSTGSLNIGLTSTNTSILNGRYVYDILLKSNTQITGEGERSKIRIIEGLATATPGVTFD